MAAAPVRTRGFERLLAAVRARSASCGAERVRRALLVRLDVAPRDHVLELGVGSGRLLSAVAARAAQGVVAGVEPDEVAYRQARRTCERGVREGRVVLLQGTSVDLSAFADDAFDKVYGVHVAYFWEDPLPHLAEIRRVLRPGGRLVLGYCDGEPGADAEPRFRAAVLEEALGACGFAQIHTEPGQPAWTSAR
jgi:ubiquinone/menaquinone biosynthesis C-methylase UbiE